MRLDEDVDDDDRERAAIVYVRVGDDRREGSIEEQRRICVDYIGSNGWQLLEERTVVDVGVPGMHDLVGLERLMVSGEDVIVVTARLDRLGGTADEIAGVVEAITDDGLTEVHAVLDGFNSPEHEHILQAVASSAGSCLDDRTQRERDEDYQQRLAEASEIIGQIPPAWPLDEGEPPNAPGNGLVGDQ